MNVTVIDPGATLGVLGGGQLGAMFATAARRMGYAVNVWDPDPEAPAHRIADHSLIRPFTDADARKEFTQRVRAVTYEWENVPADLCEQLECELPVRPSSRVLRVIQDRIEQKRKTSVRLMPPHRIVREHDNMTSTNRSIDDSSFSGQFRPAGKHSTG